MYQPTDVDTSGSGAISPNTSVGTVRLRVRDLARARAFYEQVLGMVTREQPNGSLHMGVRANRAPLLELVEDPAAPAGDPARPGLFHFALLLPSRIELAAVLLRIVRTRWPLQGASDHLVSEALYLADPEGNGIELAWDRPRAEWRTDAGGQLAMATLPLDIEALLGLLDPTWASVPSRKLLPLPDDTRMGHVHLQVSDLLQTERFYADVLGFEVRTRAYPGALFVAAGGYHHHLGLNTWNSRGGRPAAQGAAGLEWFELQLGGEHGLDELLTRLSAAQIEAEPWADGATLVRDPNGIGVVLRA